PVGVEAYAAFALRVWLASSPAVSERTRRFARWSAIAALVLGMTGQVAYHLLTQAGMTRAPWEVTTLVSCLPVLVLGMGSALAHLLRGDASAGVYRTDTITEPAIASHVNERRRTRQHVSCRGTARHPLESRYPGAAAASRATSPSRSSAAARSGPWSPWAPGRSRIRCSRPSSTGR
ncbi:MAG TPA: hypothetical protein VE733_14735, partial [Streptosporangiaceae bacterium]|nr:hypothetical protein [Streptosporangiaceae bacterium]